MSFYAIGYTAFTNALTTATGTNVTWTSGSTWGNHTIEFAINTGSGYGAWTALNAVNLSADTFNSTTGFKLKIRATTLTPASSNILTRLSIPLTTTSSDQQTKLYPLSVNTITFTGLPTGCDVVVLTAGTSTILDQVDALAATSYSYTYSGAQNIDIGFIQSGYVPYYIRNIPLGTADSSIPVALTVDRNYI
jgi:hypothetical protein